MTYVITDPCKTCLDAECVQACPVDCIVKGAEQYHIDPDSCTECGACVQACPVQAIFHETELDSTTRERWREELKTLTF